MATVATDVILIGLHSARPAAGIVGRLFAETDTATIFRDNGSSWDQYGAAAPLTNPMTTAGDIILGGSAGAPTRLAKGTDSFVLTMDPATHLPLWAAASGGGALTTVTAQLSGAVTMTNANTYYDGPSVSEAAGTWLNVAAVTVLPNGAGYQTLKLWDGTNNLASGEFAASSTYQHTTTLTWVTTPGSTTTFKVSVACSNAGASIMAVAVHNAASNTASTYIACKVA